MQSAASRIWTPVAVSISCDDYHYTTDTYTMKRIAFEFKGVRTF